ncbi:MAG: sugar phosphate isomerase/epimerase [Actinobacteria bacterium]|nr:sugar phosphate isomerase/epimerase [Actinomycetota bacterium]
MKFGVNTLLYAGAFTDRHVQELFGKFADIGFDGVEISLEKKGDIDYKKALKEFKKYGLECSSICGQFGIDRDIRGPNKEYIEGGLAYLRDLTEAAVEMNADLVAGPMYSAVGRANLEDEETKKIQWATVVENLQKAANYAKKFGINLAVEPLNRFETDFLNICSDAIKLVKDTGCKNLKVHLDAFHMNIEEKSSAMAILDAGELLYLFHTSENDRGAPGTGQVQWKVITDALKRINYNRWVVIESFTPDNRVIAKAASIWRQTEESAMALAEKGFKFLKGLMG